MKPFTFDQIPKLMGKLLDKMDHIESLLKSIRPGQKTEDQLFSVGEAAQFLNLSVATLYSKVSRNEYLSLRREAAIFLQIGTHCLDRKWKDAY